MLTMMLAAAVAIAAPLPPELPWRGASAALAARAGDPWITPAEASGFRLTPEFAATRAYAERLAAARPDLLRVEPFGRTPEGRELFAVVAMKRADAPVVLVQAGIHSGEIDGKDAGLMLLRDIALRGKDGLLDGATLVFVPVFNADGHERAGPFNRPNQRGPENQGWRTTAWNLNLNRDYLKADSPEMRAMIGLIRRHDPALYLDLHVTDGTDYQYDVTFEYAGWDGRYARSRAIGGWLDRTLRPALDGALTRAGHIPGPYINARDERDPDAGVVYDAPTARFSTGYGDARRLPTVLVETHSLKPYRQRVLGTYVLVEAALRTVGVEGATLRAAIAADRAARPAEVAVAYGPVDVKFSAMALKSVSFERVASPISGREEVRWTGRPVTRVVPVWGNSPAAFARYPAAWWVPAGATELIGLLRLHGIAFETTTAPRAMRLTMARLNSPRLGAVNEGRALLADASFTTETREETMPAGSARVPADQPLRELAALLLEPASGEGALAWNMFPGILTRTEYMEAYVVAPMAERMLAADPALRAAWGEALRDPKLAADPDARLAWFYRRSPYYDARYLVYPVGREE